MEKCSLLRLKRLIKGTWNDKNKASTDSKIPYFFQTLSKHLLKMKDKSLKKNGKLFDQDYVIPFLTRTRLLYLTWLFKAKNVLCSFITGCISNNKPIKAMIQVIFEVMGSFCIIRWIIRFSPTCYFFTFCLTNVFEVMG